MKFNKKTILTEGAIPTAAEERFFNTINKKVAPEANLTEDFSYTNEHIESCITNVEDCFGDLRDALFSLESSLEDYPEIANSIKALNYELEDFGRSINLDIEDIYDTINPQMEEEEDEE